MTVKQTEFMPPRRALRIIQGGGTPVYLFSLTAGEILQVAEISRVGARGPQRVDRVPAA